jgi:hypothetical protein
MPDILCVTYEIPIKESSKYTIYDIQNTLLISLILVTLEQDHHYLLQDKAYAWD